MELRYHFTQNLDAEIYKAENYKAATVTISFIMASPCAVSNTYSPQTLNREISVPKLLNTSLKIGKIFVFRCSP